MWSAAAYYFPFEGVSCRSLSASVCYLALHHSCLLIIVWQLFRNKQYKMWRCTSLNDEHLCGGYRLKGLVPCFITLNHFKIYGLTDFFAFDATVTKTTATARRGGIGRMSCISQSGTLAGIVGPHVNRPSWFPTMGMAARGQVGSWRVADWNRPIIRQFCGPRRLPLSRSYVLENDNSFLSLAKICKIILKWPLGTLWETIKRWSVIFFSCFVLISFKSSTFCLKKAKSVALFHLHWLRVLFDLNPSCTATSAACTTVWSRRQLREHINETREEWKLNILWDQYSNI